MKILSRDRKSAHFKMDLGVEDGFSADNQDEENNFEILDDLLEESDFQIAKEDDLYNDISFIYVHKILFIATFALFWSEKTYFRLALHVLQVFWLNFLEFSKLCQKP